MTSHHGSCPLTLAEALDLYFVEHRAKLVDLAAFFDRLDRALPDSGRSVADGRADALRDAVAILLDGKGDRAARILETLSDPTTEPRPAAGGKGALGAWLETPPQQREHEDHKDEKAVPV